MLENFPTGVRSTASQYKGLAMGAAKMLVHLAFVGSLLSRAVSLFVPGLATHLTNAGIGLATAELASSVAIHVVCGVLLFAVYTHGVRTSFYNRSRDAGLFPNYSWAMDFVEERQLGGTGAEQWAQTPPTWSETTAALGLGLVVLTFGLLATGAPVVGLALATAAHAIARRRGIRPVRPHSWHLAITTLLAVVTTVFVSALLHFDGATEWIGRVGDAFLGLFVDSQVSIAALLVLTVLLVVTHVVVTYVGVYYLLVAVDGVRVRAGLVPTDERAAEPADGESAGTTSDDRGTFDRSESADSQSPEGETGTDVSANESQLENGHAPPAVLASVAAFVLLLAVVVPLADDTAVGAASVMLFSGLIVAAVTIFVGIPTESVVGGVTAGIVLAAVGGLAVHAASVVGPIDGAERTALFAMAMWVGTVVGILGWAAIVADRSKSP